MDTSSNPTNSSVAINNAAVTNSPSADGTVIAGLGQPNMVDQKSATQAAIINDKLEAVAPAGTPQAGSTEVFGQASSSIMPFYRKKKNFQIIGIFLPFFITFLIVLTGGIYIMKNNRWEELEHNQKIKLASITVIINLILTSAVFFGLILMANR